MTAEASIKCGPASAAETGTFDQFLLEFPLFAGLDKPSLTELQGLVRPFHVTAGSMLFRQGDRSNGLYLIEEGEIAILRRVPGDDTVQLALLARGAMVGEMALLDRGVRSAGALALTASTGYFVSYERFERMRADLRPPAFALMDRFVTHVARRTRKAIEQIRALLVSRASSPPAPTDAAWPPGSSPQSLSEEALLALPFFGSFSPEQLREFIAPLKRHDFARGDLVYSAGSAASNCLMIVRGALAMYFSALLGAEMLSVHGPGTMVGELPLLDGGPHPLICVAREPTIALSLERERFELLRKGGTELAFTFFAVLSSAIARDLRRANSELARLAPQHHRGDILVAP
jgi:CRP-like cAMP-binding protein